MTDHGLSRSRRRVTFGGVVLAVVGALGELLVTAGLVVLLYVAWQMWWQNAVVGNEQQQAAVALRDQWNDASGSGSGDDNPDDLSDVPVASTPAEGSIWGLIYVPRFGSDWIRPIAEGTDMNTVLNRIGVGKYTQTVMPGAIGNTVLASHRSGMGSSFYAIDKLRLGDQIVIETKDGWYTYTYRNSQYVMYTAVEILAPVPGDVDEKPGARILSLQSCTPLPFSGNERIIAYAELTGWQSRSAGPPDIVAQMNGDS